MLHFRKMDRYSRTNLTKENAMPANLDTPIQIKSGPSTTAEISIQEIVICPAAGSTPGSISMVIAQGEGATANRIPGIFVVDDCKAHTETIGDRVFDIAEGDYFSDAASAAPDPTATSMLMAVKIGAYNSLMAKYTALQGNIG